VLVCAFGVAVIAILLISRSGRVTLSDNTTIQVDPSQIKYRVLDPISSAQKIFVTAKSSEPFNIYVFLEKDLAAVEKDIQADKASDKAITYRIKTDSANLEAMIPANEKAVVGLSSAGGKKTDVKLKITN